MNGRASKPIHTLLICGGGGSEHEISLRTADFIQQQLQAVSDIAVIRVTMAANGHLTCSAGKRCELRSDRKLHGIRGNTQAIEYVIPAIHGYPGETGDLQSYLEMIGLPYFGCSPEASKNCFNKVTAKLWFQALGIDNTPYQFLCAGESSDLAKARRALSEWGELFVKASNQGSSVGCYKVRNAEELNKALNEAFQLSAYVLVEKCIRARELEVAVYEYDGKLCITPPGEICTPADTFYSYEEKYTEASRAQTFVLAEGLSDTQLNWIKTTSRRAFAGLQLQDLSRIDFFLTDDGDIYLNEVNTFPGMTSISMFPKMLEQAGHDFSYYLSSLIRKACVPGSVSVK